MLQSSQAPKPQSPNADFEIWRDYAARVSQAIRERREDAYQDSRADAANRAGPTPRAA